MAIGAALISVLAGAAVNAGIAALSAPNVSTPNAAASGRRGVLADVSTLPGARAVEGAARLGQAVDYWVPSGQMPIQQAIDRGLISPQDAIWAQLTNRTGTVNVGGHYEHADFTGRGDIDVQAQLAQQNAENALATQQRFGVDFARVGRQQAELADPLGFSARTRLHDELQKRDEQNAQLGHPVAGPLDSQVLAELQRGRALDPDAAQAVADVVARRGGAGQGVGADMAGGLEQGPAGEARLARRQQHALSFLSSGATPEDVDYRRNQQSLSDMANFLAGRTPEAQFGALSGAQRGTTPQARAPGLPGTNPDAANLGQQGALSNYSAAVRNAGQTVPDWFAGINTLVRGAQAAGAAGFRPMA